MAIVAQEIKVDEPRHAEEQLASKRSAGKRKSSDVFKSFSRPKIGLKQENTDVWTGASHALDTASLVSTTFSVTRGKSNVAC